MNTDIILTIASWLAWLLFALIFGGVGLLAVVIVASLREYDRGSAKRRITWRP